MRLPTRSKNSLATPALAVTLAMGWSLAGAQNANPAPGGSPDTSASPAKQLGKISVEDTADDTTTENTGSYTSRGVTIGKTAQPLREIPQSVTVITRQRLDDQNVSSVPDALKFAPGVTVYRFDGSGNQNSFYARGYPADSFLIDGLKVRSDNFAFLDLDLATFDHIEVLRGPAGLFTGPGEPGITINLTRKRALADPQLKTLVGGGSWNNYRGELDGTGALTGSGAIRGRAVAVYEHRDSYLHGVDSEKKTIYGTLEFDLSPQSTLSVGATYQDLDSVIDQGLPAFADGTLLNVPRSTAIIADWNTETIRTTDAFAELQNNFSNGSSLKVAVRRIQRRSAYAGARARSILDPDGTIGVEQVALAADEDDLAADVFFNWPFKIAGREQQWLVGIDYRDGLTLNRYAYADDLEGNVYAFDHNIPRPVFVEDESSRNRTTSNEYGVYSRLNLRLVDGLTVLLGGRTSWWQSHSRNPLTGDSTSGYDAEGQFTPYVGMVYDLTRLLSLYASYTDIFQPQDARTFTGEQIKPRSGYQVEAGIKGEFLHGALNTSAAVFRLSDKNRAITDPEHDDFSLSLGKVRSQGAETEISGKLSPNWDIAGGYTYTTTKYLTGEDGQQGQVFNTFTPKHTFSLWTHYVIAQGPLNGLQLGAGARAVSNFYAISRGAQFVGDGYAVASAELGYTIAKRHKVALNFDNLFDKKYYEKISGPFRQNFYGAPRSVMLTIRSQF